MRAHSRPAEMGRVWTAPVGKGFFEAMLSAGWSGHVSGHLSRPFNVLQAMVPLARAGSRLMVRARSATAQNGFFRSGGFNWLGASTPRCPFQLRRRGSSASNLYAATVDVDAVRSLRDQGLGGTEIAKQLGIGRASVYRALSD